jgi:hypothetical protein
MSPSSRSDASLTLAWEGEEEGIFSKKGVFERLSFALLWVAVS